jgi:hypothetical protein
MVFVVFVLHELSKGPHARPCATRGVLLGLARPFDTHLATFDGRGGVVSVEDLLEGLRLFGHPFWGGAALLLYHGKVFDVFSGLEEELACVQLDKNADHGPDITLLVPVTAFEDYLWGSVLSGVDD